MKRRLLVHGNCQGGWLANALQGTPEVADEYDITYHANFGIIPADHPIHDPEFLAHCSCVLWQTASGFKPPRLLAALPSDCRQIRFPTLWLKLLWPTYTVDPRNKPETAFPFGRYPYGDRLVLKLLGEGVTLEDLPRRYRETDLNQMINLDRFAEMCLAELRFNDQQSDIAVAPYIENTFRQQKLFGCINHPSMRILDRLRLEILSALLGCPVPTNPPPPVNASDVLGPEEIPVHPQIIDYFKLEWACPGMRWRYHSAFLTVEEYVRALAAFDPIPLGDSPQVWFGRAEQAFAQQDSRDAERLLREGTIRFPLHSEFAQCLGVLLNRQNRYAEAERVFRDGLKHHPLSVALQNELGLALYHQGHLAQAIAAFERALRLDPGHDDARRNLAFARQLPPRCTRTQPLTAETMPSFARGARHCEHPKTGAPDALLAAGHPLRVTRTAPEELRLSQAP